MILLVLIVALSIALMLIRPGNIPEAYWVGAGALLLVLLRLIPFDLAGRAVGQGLDVYLFLIGMMLMSELARDHGLFDWVSAVAVKHSRGSAVRLFTLVYLLGVGVTVFMSNDATAVVLTPAILPAIRTAKVNPLPCLFACVLIANAASFVLPISNPANLVVFHDGMPPLGQWLGWLLIPSLCSIASTYLVLRILFRNSLRAPCQASAQVPPLTGPARMVLAGLGAMTVVLLVTSALKRDLGAPTCGCALLVVGVVSWRYRANPLRLAREISWSTLLLVAGLFVMVNAIENAGVLRLTTQWLGHVQSLSPARGAFLSGFAVGAANNLVNNLPLGLLAGGTLHAVHAGHLLANAILIGIDLGPNLSITGSLATVLWLIALRRHKIEMSFWVFLKIGVVAMPAALLVSLGGLLLSEKLAGANEASFTPTSRVLPRDFVRQPKSDQAGDGDRLGQMMMGAEPGSDVGFGRIVARGQDRDQRALFGFHIFQPRQHVETRNAWHLQIKKDQIAREISVLLVLPPQESKVIDCRLAAVQLDDSGFDTGLAEHPFQEELVVFVIFDDENLFDVPPRHIAGIQKVRVA